MLDDDDDDDDTDDDDATDDDVGLFNGKLAHLYQYKELHTSYVLS